jgi:hypothetical protein
VLPLAPLQDGLLFHALYDGAGPDPYLQQGALELSGPLDAGRLRAAVQSLVDRHASLRAGFMLRRCGEPVQVIPGQVQVPWHDADLTALGATAQQDELSRLLTQDRGHRVDPAVPPLLRVLLVRLAPDQHILVLTVHHILWDGWSMSRALDDLFRLYQADGVALPPPVPFRDYLAWITAQDHDAARQAWTRHLAGLDQPTLVAPSVSASAEPALDERLDILLSEQLTATMTAAARGLGLTLGTVTQGAWALLLAMLTGQQDVVFGTTVSGRPPELPGVEGIVGLLINIIPVRVRIDPAEPLAALLTRIQDQQTALTPYHYLRLAEIQRLTPVTGPLFDTSTNFQNFPHIDGPDGIQMPSGLVIRDADDAAKAPPATTDTLGVIAIPGRRLRLRLNYRPDIVDEEMAGRVAMRLQKIFEAVAADPASPCKDVMRDDSLGEPGPHLCAGTS